MLLPNARNGADKPPIRHCSHPDEETKRMLTFDAFPSHALRRATEELEYAIAHELRAPLRAVSATAGVLLEELGDGLSESHRALLERQARSAVRFARLIDDVLDLSRLGHATVHRERVDVTVLARSFGGRVEAQGGMAVDADPRLVAVVIECLLDNALKFSTGIVRVRQVGGVFSVSDEGAGFDAAHATRLFRPFERLVGEEVSGTGIGLAKVHRIVERHGGRAWIESAPARGTTVFFTLGALAAGETYIS